MKRTVYWPCQMVESVNIEVMGIKQKLPMNWNDGQIGVMLVFESEEAAEAYAEGKSIVMSGTVE